eukprot:365542-Chlamydomonas_euryale.AAC.30
MLPLAPTTFAYSSRQAMQWTAVACCQSCVQASHEPRGSQLQALAGLQTGCQARESWEGAPKTAEFQCARQRHLTGGCCASQLAQTAASLQGTPAGRSSPMAPEVLAHICVRWVLDSLHFARASLRGCAGWGE